MPTPSYAAPQTASPGTRGHGRPDPRRPGRGGRRRTAAARRPSAARGCRRVGPRGRSRRPGRRSDAATSSSSGTWRTASSRCRPTEVRSTQQAVAGLADPVPLGEGERRGLDRPAVDRRHEEAGAREVGHVRGARKASVTTAIEAYSIAGQLARPPRARRRRAAGRSARPGSASTTASASHHLGRRGRPDDEREAVGGARAARAPVAPVRTVERPLAPARTRQPAHAAARCPANTGPAVGRAGASPRPRDQRAVAAPARTSCGHGRPGGELAGRGRRTRRRAAARRAGRRPRRRAASATSVADRRRPRRRRAGRPGVSWRSRSTPGGGQHARAPRPARGRPARPSPSAAAAAARRGSRPTPRWSPGGRRGSPSSRGEVDALGPAGQHRLGADVDRRRPPTSRGRSLPPMLGDALEHQDVARRPRPASRAAASPAMPPPTTTTRTAARLGHAPSLSPSAARNQPRGTGRRTPMRTTRLARGLGHRPARSPSRPARAGPTATRADAATAMDGGAARRVRRRHGRVGAAEAPADAAAASKERGRRAATRSTSPPSRR